MYGYYQTKSPDGVSQQFYVGPDDGPTRALIARHRAPTARAARQHLARLCAAAMALAKLLVHVGRSRSNPSKARKDLEQAASLIDDLTRTDPRALHEAWENLVSPDPSSLGQARSGLEALARRHADIECGLDERPLLPV